MSLVLGILRYFTGVIGVFKKALESLHRVPSVLLVMSIVLFTIVILAMANAMASLEDIAPFALMATGIGIMAMGIEIRLQGDSLATASLDKRSISVRLMWGHQFQFCGLYHANGNGASVELIEGGTPIGLEPIACVIERIDDYGVTTAVELIRSHTESAKFREAEIVPVLVIFRRSPVVAIAKNNTELSLDGFRNSRIAFFSSADSTYREFSYLAQHCQLGSTDATFLEDEKSLYDPMEVLRTDTANYRIGYAFNEGLTAEMTPGYHWEYLHSLFGETLYADVLFARHDVVRGKHEQTMMLAKSVQQGYIACIQEINVTLKLLRQYCPSGHEQIAQAMKAGKDPLGHVTTMLNESIGLTPGVSSDCLIGSTADWHRMEAIVGVAQGSYASLLQEHGMFDWR